jgi:hypothetical protein
MPITARAGHPSAIQPDTVYGLQHWIEIAGISYSRIVNARKAGIELKMISVSPRRKYVRGSDGIAFIERLAEAASEAEAKKA